MSSNQIALKNLVSMEHLTNEEVMALIKRGIEFKNGAKVHYDEQHIVADFRETGSIAKERKKKIIVSIYILMGISIALAPIIWVKIFLFALTIFITYYLFKVIPDKE